MLDAQFVTTAVAPAGYPKPGPPEVAFVGRSNVGKSSMINALAQRRKLVRVSNTPGRTRALNFFDVKVEDRGAPRDIRFVDLPGYGYAKVSKTERKTWQTLIDTYLKGRKALKIVVSIIDAEVGPTETDHQTLEFLTGAAPRILCVATKIDRLPKAKRKPRMQELAGILELPREVLVAFSATDGIGHDEVWSAILSELKPEK